MRAVDSYHVEKEIIMRTRTRVLTFKAVSFWLIAALALVGLLLAPLATVLLTADPIAANPAPSDVVAVAPPPPEPPGGIGPCGLVWGG
jgi:hypothetical protein